mmetsp:Transcript_40781/g.63667  ORF Transcript_40781/g.63667 Transcript_40781/m.63667 type:complete len:193 (-) Transcript_40781:1063-1641(-)
MALRAGVGMALTQKHDQGGFIERPVLDAIPASLQPKDRADRLCELGTGGGIYVSGVNPGGSVDKEGTIQVGDCLVGIDGMSVEGKTVSELVPHITGPVHSVVILDLQRGGQQYQVRLQRSGGANVPRPAAATQPRPVQQVSSAQNGGQKGPPSKGSSRLGGDSTAGGDVRALAAEAAMRRQNQAPKGFSSKR